MNRVTLKAKEIEMFQLKNESENTCFYATHQSAGFDICSNEKVEIQPGEWKLVKTGLSILESLEPQIEGLKSFGKLLPELQIRPRSGLAAKFGVTVLNAPATIDADYRGEIQVILMNHGKQVFQVSKGDRIAQALVSVVFQLPCVPVKSVERGMGGFGSSGIKSI